MRNHNKLPAVGLAARAVGKRGAAMQWRDESALGVAARGSPSWFTAAAESASEPGTGGLYFAPLCGAEG
jgi:hypothetical protein